MSGEVSFVLKASIAAYIAKSATFEFEFLNRLVISGYIVAD